MATYRDVMIKALQEDKFKMKSLNKNLMEVAMSTKKRAGFVKVAVDDQFVTNIMARKDVAFILYMNGDEMNELVDSMENDDERPEANDSTELPNEVVAGQGLKGETP